MMWYIPGMGSFFIAYGFQDMGSGPWCHFPGLYTISKVQGTDRAANNVQWLVITGYFFHATPTYIFTGEISYLVHGWTSSKDNCVLRKYKKHCIFFNFSNILISYIPFKYLFLFISSTFTNMVVGIICCMINGQDLKKKVIWCGHISCWFSWVIVWAYCFSLLLSRLKLKMWIIG